MDEDMNSNNEDEGGGEATVFEGEEEEKVPSTS